MLTLEAIFAQPDNEAALRHMKFTSPSDVGYFAAGTDGSPFDEGGQIFFHRYGRRAPDAARCAMGTYNVLVHETTGRIFAIHEGRFTISFRPAQPPRPLRAEGPGPSAMDPWINRYPLGPDWMDFNDEDEDEEGELLQRAYEHAGR